MRVAHIGIKGVPAKGGAERVVEAIARRMSGLGIVPVVYCDRSYTSSDASIPGVELVRIPTVPGRFTRQTILDSLQALHAVIFGNYDLIHLHHMEAGFVLPLLRLRYKVVGTSHGWRGLKKWGALGNYLMRSAYKPFMSLSSVVTIPSELGVDELRRRYNRQPVYIPNGVEPDYSIDEQAASEILERLGLSKGNYVIFVAGRVLPEKGADLVIEAFNKLGLELPLLIVGGLDETSDFARLLHQMAGSNVVFHPLIGSESTLYGLVAGARCMVFPSRLETMSMVLLEAAGLGVPIICSDIPENSAVMKEDALYFRSGDVDSLANSIGRFLADESASISLARRARERLVAEQSWDLVAQQYAEMYRNVLGRGT